MNDTVWVLLVIYQKNGEDSSACRALRDMGYPRVLVADNSRTDFGNAAYCAQAGWEYVSMDGNKGLPKAYNAGIDRLRGKADTVVLLDDDTTLTAAYFEALAVARAAHPEAQVFLPRVTDVAGLLSPCRTGGRGFSRAQAAEDIPPAELTAINSGMAVAMSVFDTYRYDERLFLDFVDHAFMRDMRACGTVFAPIDAELTQSFSGSERYDAAAAKTRFRLFRRDSAVYYGDTLSGRLYYPLCVLRRWLSLKKRALCARR